MQKIYIQPLFTSSKMPTRATLHSANFDVYAHFKNRVVTIFNDQNTAVKEDFKGKLVLLPGDRAIVPSGLKMCCDPGWKIEIFSRSGSSIKLGLMLTNAVGQIDADYRDELMILVSNTSGVPVEIKHDDRIAQFCLRRVVDFKFVAVAQLPETESLRDGGIGSTG